MTETAYTVPAAAACLECGGIYRDWLKEHALEAGLWLVSQNDVKLLQKLLAEGLMDACADRLIEAAIAEKKIEAEALLLEYKDRHTAAGTDLISKVLDSELAL